MKHTQPLPFCVRVNPAGICVQKTTSLLTMTFKISLKGCLTLALTQGSQSVSELEKLSPELGGVAFCMPIDNAFVLH